MTPATQTEPTFAVRNKHETLVATAKSLTQKYLISPKVFAEEQAQIFSKEWLLVGHQSQLASPGDYIVQQVNGESLIVIRDKAGKIHGFFNVCRHRGTPTERGCVWTFVNYARRKSIQSARYEPEFYPQSHQKSYKTLNISIRVKQ